MTDFNLLDTCRHKIERGALPGTLRVATYGGSSDGATCAVCGTVIARGATELQLEWPVGNTPTKAQLHPACYEEWAAAVRGPPPSGNGAA